MAIVFLCLHPFSSSAHYLHTAVSYASSGICTLFLLPAYLHTDVVYGAGPCGMSTDSLAIQFEGMGCNNRGAPTSLQVAALWRHCSHRFLQISRAFCTAELSRAVRARMLSGGGTSGSSTRSRCGRVLTVRIAALVLRARISQGGIKDDLMVCMFCMLCGIMQVLSCSAAADADTARACWFFAPSAVAGGA